MRAAIDAHLSMTLNVTCGPNWDPVILIFISMLAFAGVEQGPPEEHVPGVGLAIP